MNPIQSSRLLLAAAMSLTAGILAVRTVHAQSWEIGPFVRPLDAPVIEPNRFYSFFDPITHQETFWDNLAVFDPGAAIAPDGEVAILFRAKANSEAGRGPDRASRLSLATSKDGLFFTVDGAPILSPENDPHPAHHTPYNLLGPRIVVGPHGGYVMTYTESVANRRANGKRQDTIRIATSRNLRHWTQWGPAFAAALHSAHGKGAQINDGSAAILTELRHGRLQAAKLHGRYWMYWGEKAIHLATSPDLLHWTPVLDRQSGRPLIILSARAGRFDSGSATVGPPPLLTRRGILLIYNGENSLRGVSNASNTQVADAPTPAAPPSPTGSEQRASARISPLHPDEARLQADPTLRPGAYAVGEALFSAADPARLLERTAQPVLQPVWPYERNGRRAAGGVFAEGLVSRQGQWLLYYGAADSVIGVARAPLH